MKPALEKFLLIAATLAAIGLFIFVAMWSSIKDKKTQMDDLFNNTKCTLVSTIGALTSFPLCATPYRS